MFPLKVKEDDLLGWLLLYIPGSNVSINDDYFKSVIKLSQIIEFSELKNHINGFYLSKYNNRIRFSYFTNRSDTLDFLRDYLFKNDFTIDNEIQIPKTEKFERYCKYNKSNKDFRRYLQLITNIGIDLINYDVLYARKVVAKYRLEIVPENKNVKLYFNQVFQKSEYYKSLSQDIKDELLNGLSFWVDDYNDWAHMLVVMLLPEDLNKSIYEPKKILNTNDKNIILKTIFGEMVALDI